MKLGSIAVVRTYIIGVHLCRDLTRIYLRDVLDHINTVVEEIETLEFQCRDLIDLIFNSISHQTNQSMQTLAIVSVIFLPISFIAGVYGTNFDKLPELHWELGYLYFWVLCAAITLAFSLFLRRILVVSY